MLAKMYPPIVKRIISLPIAYIIIAYDQTCTHFCSITFVLHAVCFLYIYHNLNHQHWNRMIGILWPIFIKCANYTSIGPGVIVPLSTNCHVTPGEYPASRIITQWELYAESARRCKPYGAEHAQCRRRKWQSAHEHVAGGHCESGEWRRRLRQFQVWISWATGQSIRHNTMVVGWVVFRTKYILFMFGNLQIWFSLNCEPKLLAFSD